MTVKTTSQRRISLILNGHLFEGWATEDQPVQFPGFDLVEVSRGRDGILYASDTGQRGGEMTVMLHPTSPTAQRILQWRNDHMRDQDVIFEGIYNDPDLGVSLTMRDGKLKRADEIVVQGKNYEATWEFQETISNVDGGTPNEAPRRVGA